LSLVFLVDIEEFYEATLLDQSLNTNEKTRATLMVAEKYEGDSHMQNGAEEVITRENELVSSK